MTSVVDWKKVRKECKKLGIFDGFYNCSNTPFEQQCWNVVLSVRNTGKTTSYVLLGMVLYKMYGVRLEYCRLMPDDIRPKDHKHFFDSIISYGYIQKLTNGRFNSVVYKAGFWYYRTVDDKGVETDISEEPFMHTFAIRSAYDMKSNYTSNSVFLIFDEFIDPSKRYNDDFCLLADCISTIARSRYIWVNCLSNTLDRQSIWFKEMCIAREVTELKQGESKRIAKEGCTPVLVSILANTVSVAKQKHNLALFSFKNPKLEAITGTTDGWSFRIFPRMPKGKTEYILRNIYMNADGFIIRLDFCKNDKVGFCLNVVDSSESDPLENHDDAIMLTTDNITRDREVYLSSNAKISALIQKFIKENKVFFGTNNAGLTFEHFISHNHVWNK